MNKQEAYKIAASELALIKESSFSEIQAKVGSKIEKKIHGNSNALYEITVSYYLHPKSNDAIKVKCQVTDLNWYKFEMLEESITIKKQQ